MYDLLPTTVKFKGIFFSTLFCMQPDVTYYDLVVLHLEDNFSSKLLFSYIKWLKKFIFNYSIGTKISYRYGVEYNVQAMFLLSLSLLFL